MDQVSSHKKIEESLNVAQNSYLEYKKNENNKIIQFFHITVLVILGLFTKYDDCELAVICLCVALLMMSFGYMFFYLADFHNANVNMYSYLKNIDKNFPTESEIILYKEKLGFIKCRHLYVLSVIVAHALIFLSLFLNFNLLALCTANVISTIFIVAIVTGVFIVNLLRFYHW